MPVCTHIPDTLTGELVARLGRLSGQPDGVAEVVLSVLPYGSRVSLIAHRIIEPVATKGDAAVQIVITTYGRELIEACAEQTRDNDNDEQRHEAASELEHAHAEWRSGSANVQYSRRHPAQRGSGEVPSTLTRELVSRLARLHNQPEGVAEVALSALSYQSRESLIDHGVIKPVHTVGDDAVEIAITDYGWELIDACAEQTSDDDDEQQRREAEHQLKQAHDERGRCNERTTV